MLALGLLLAGGILAALEPLPPPPAVDPVAFEAAYADLDAADLTVRERAVVRPTHGKCVLLGGASTRDPRAAGAVPPGLERQPVDAGIGRSPCMKMEALLGESPAALDVWTPPGEPDSMKASAALSARHKDLGLSERNAEAQAYAARRLLEFRTDPVQGEIAAILALETVGKGGIPVLEKVLPLLPELFCPPASKGIVTTRGKLAGGQGTFTRNQQGVRHLLFQNATTQIAYRVTAASPESLRKISKAFAALAEGLSTVPNLEGKIDMTYVFRAASWGERKRSCLLAKTLAGKPPARCPGRPRHPPQAHTPRPRLKGRWASRPGAAGDWEGSWRRAS